MLGDITDTSAVAAAVRHGVVVHAAAKVAIVGPWDEFEATNIGGTRNVVQAARAGVSRFVYVSSPSVAHAGRIARRAAAGRADPSGAG